MDYSSPSSAKVQKASLPISRTNGPGYERSERARTSHACEPCRERKTKCDGERPSCRRCLHTGTSCHYGYGKGWRKRKTAEDLSVTSKKLQRYEALLNDISPMVSAEVRAMIDDVRQQETLSNSASEMNESTNSSMSSSMTPSLGADRERSGSGPTGRMPPTLPIPGVLVPGQPRPQSAMPYERMSESTSPHLAHHPKRDGNFEDGSINRLPSITPDGVLIESGARNASPIFPPTSLSANHGSAEQFSPPTGSSYGTGSSSEHTDGWVRTPASSTIGLNNSVYQSHSRLLLTS